MRVLLNNFNAGLLDETLTGRVDLPNLGRGALRLQSFLPRIVGGLERRPGLVYCGAAKYHDRASRLIAFNFSRTQRFQLEMADGVLRVWKDGVLQSAEYPAPWTAANAHEWHFVQINDVAFLTHRNGPITVITRRGDNDWLVEDFDTRLIAEPNGWPPMRDENIEATTIAASGSTGSVNLTASAPLWSADDVGSFYEINHRRASTIIDLDLAATGTRSSSEMAVLGKWQLLTFGKWSGELFLETKTPSGGWETYRSWKSANADRNVGESGDFPAETTIRMRYVATAAGSEAPRAEFNVADSLSRGLVRVTGYTSPTVVAATVIRPIYATSATSRWAEGAWSRKRGYPRTVTLFEQRLVFAGSDSDPQRIIGSAESDLFNFRRDATAAAAWDYVIAAQESSPIRWLGPSSAGLIAGTEKEEWLLTGGDSAVTPVTTPQIRRYTGYGASGVQPILAGTAMIFVQDGARAVLEYAWSEADRSFIAPDLSELVEGYMQSGVVQVAWQRNPYSVVWFVLADGRLMSLTYRREKEIVAWAEHPTAGFVESVAVTNGDDGIDEVWISVRRTVNTLTRRHVERLDSATHRGLLASDRMRMTYLDAAKRVTLAAAATEFPGFEHLEGELVSVVADGATRPPIRVVAGRIILEEPAQSVLAGLPYRSAVRTMPIEVQMDDGTAQGRTMKVSEMALSVWRSAAGSYQDVSVGREYPVELRDATESLSDPVALKTRVCRLQVGGSFSDSVALEIATDQPEPLNLLWLSLGFSVHGN